MTLIGLWLWSSALPAQPLVAILIDDLGHRWSEGQRALELEGPVSLSILPASPVGRRIAQAAAEHGKEVMLHAPMQAVGGAALGPNGLTIGMSRALFLQTLATQLDAIPGVAGVNNHMGSELTRHQQPMAWLMQTLKTRGLFFIDSRTTAVSLAGREAQRAGVAHWNRDLFLDHHRSTAAVNAAFDRLLELAAQHGAALAIGHPYPETLAVLERRLPELARQGVRLVPASTLVAVMQAAPAPSADFARQGRQLGQAPRPQPAVPLLEY